MISIERSLVTPRWQRVALPIVSLVMAFAVAVTVPPDAVAVGNAVAENVSVASSVPVSDP